MSMNPQTFFSFLAALFKPTPLDPANEIITTPASFSPQTGANFDPKVALWLINATSLAYSYERTPNRLIPLIQASDSSKRDILYVDNFGLLDLPGLSSFKNLPVNPKAPLRAPVGFIAPLDPTDDGVNRIVLAIRGTVNPSDVVTDMSYTLVPLTSKLANLAIHTGISTAMYTKSASLKRSLKEQIFASLDKYLSSTGQNELYITGHSLGAALATLALFEIATAYPDLRIIGYNFASPRFANRAFAKSFNELGENRTASLTTFRVYNSEDTITNLPLPIMPGVKETYAHTNDGWVFARNTGLPVQNHILTTYEAVIRGLNLGL
ncbi:MAG: lipase family protein [Verrucomicrobia bacterium]|nr:lipase family protein [Verrucomicrobiota bacterium]